MLTCDLGRVVQPPRALVVSSADLCTVDNETHFKDLKDSVRNLKCLTQCLVPCELIINLGYCEFSKRLFVKWHRIYSDWLAGARAPSLSDP